MSLNHDQIYNYLIELNKIINIQSQKTAELTNNLFKNIELYSSNNNLNYFNYIKENNSDRFLLQKKRRLIKNNINNSFNKKEIQNEINFTIKKIPKRKNNIVTNSNSEIEANFISKLKELKSLKYNELMLKEIETMYNKLSRINHINNYNLNINNNINNIFNSIIMNNQEKNYNLINNNLIYNNNIFEQNKNDNDKAQINPSENGNSHNIKVIKNNKVVYADPNFVNEYTLFKKENKNKKIIKGKRRSIYRGVSKNGNQWQVLMVHNKGKSYVGSFFSEEIAGRVYDILAIKKKGIKAKTNFIYNNEQIKRITEANIDIKSKNIYEIIDNMLN